MERSPTTAAYPVPADRTRRRASVCHPQQDYLATLAAYLRPRMSWLDLGCGREVIPAWLPNAADIAQSLRASCPNTFGVDIDFARLRGNPFIRHKLTADLTRLALAGSSFDLCTANMVVEHLQDPAAVLREIRRVLKPGGWFLFHTTNRLNYRAPIARWLPWQAKVKLIKFLQGRTEEEIFPTYYRMNTHRRIRRLLQREGFRLLEVKHLESPPETAPLGWLSLPERWLGHLLRLPALQFFRSNLIVVAQVEK